MGPILHITSIVIPEQHFLSAGIESQSQKLFLTQYSGFSSILGLESQAYSHHPFIIYHCFPRGVCPFSAADSQYTMINHTHLIGNLKTLMYQSNGEWIIASKQYSRKAQQVVRKSLHNN